MKELSIYFQKFSTQTRLLSLPSPHELPSREAQEYPLIFFSSFIISKYVFYIGNWASLSCIRKIIFINASESTFLKLVFFATVGWNIRLLTQLLHCYRSLQVLWLSFIRHMGLYLVTKSDCNFIVLSCLVSLRFAQTLIVVASIQWGLDMIYLSETLSNHQSHWIHPCGAWWLCNSFFFLHESGLFLLLLLSPSSPQNKSKPVPWIQILFCPFM